MKKPYKNNRHDNIHPFAIASYITGSLNILWIGYFGGWKWATPFIIFMIVVALILFFKLQFKNKMTSTDDIGIK